MTGRLSQNHPDRLRRRRTIRRLALYGAALFLLLIVFFAHFLFERDQRRLVAQHLGAPLSGPELAPAPGPSIDAPRRVWIDTDAGCGRGRRVDVDDCFALATALFAPELDVQGIASTFGNVPLAEADLVTRELVALIAANGGVAPPLHRGAAEPGFSATAASEALARALAQGPVTVIALGPLTNIATTLEAYPALAANLVELIAVAGKRSGQWMHPGYDHFITFSDFNVAKDPEAVRRILERKIPIALLPFEAALDVAITPGDLDQIAAASEVGRWLRDRSNGWMQFWRKEGSREGFVPFDNAATLYAIKPDLLSCVRVRAELTTSPPWFGIGRPTELVVRDVTSDGGSIRYCRRQGPEFDKFLRERLLRLKRDVQRDKPMPGPSR